MTIILSLLPQKSLPWYFFYDNTFLADDNISLDNTTSLADNITSLIDISLNKSSNEPRTSITAKDKGIESQMKRPFDLHEQIYDHAMIMYQKQEKMVVFKKCLIHNIQN